MAAMVIRDRGSRVWMALAGAGALIVTIAMWSGGSASAGGSRSGRDLAWIDLAELGGGAIAATEDGDADHRIAIAPVVLVCPPRLALRLPGGGPPPGTESILEAPHRLRLAPKTSPPRLG